jgi:hypothetical protein
MPSLFVKHMATRPRGSFLLQDRLDRFLEAVDVDRIIALVHGPGDVTDKAHADL